MCTLIIIIIIIIDNFCISLFSGVPKLTARRFGSTSVTTFVAGDIVEDYRKAMNK